MFPDTNVWLHFRDFREFDWSKRVGDAEVTLVLTTQAVAEIDAVTWKQGPERVRQRAKGISRACRQLLETSNPAIIRPGLALEQQTAEPELTVDFGASLLSRESQDDRQLACILAYAKAHPERESSIAFVAADNNAYLKARARKVAALFLDDDERLPPEPDERDVELKKLRSELVRLQSRSPRLTLGFAEEQTHAIIPIRPSRPITESALDRQVERERGRCKYVPSEGIAVALLGGPPDEQAVADYQKQVEAYLTKFRAAKQSGAERDALVSLGATVSLVLANGGTLPADDVDIVLTVPEFVRVARVRPLPDEVETPMPPARPSPILAQLPAGVHAAKSDPLLFGVAPIKLRDFVAKPSGEPRVSIRSNGGPQSVRIHVPRLKHNERESLPAVSFWFDNTDDVGNFALEARITCASLPDAQEAKLHVVVRDGLNARDVTAS